MRVESQLMSRIYTLGITSYSLESGRKSPNSSLTGQVRTVLLKPLTPFIWKIESLDGQRTLEAHIQRLKRYSDASLNAPQRLIEEVRGEQEQCELDHFVAWRVQRDTLRVELKCRWRGFSEAWDTFEDVESHLWESSSIRKDIINYLHLHKDQDPIIKALLSRLVSQLKKTDLPAGPKNKSKSRDKGRSRGRGKAKANVAINDAKRLTESLSTNDHQGDGLLVN